METDENLHDAAKKRWGDGASGSGETNNMMFSSQLQFLHGIFKIFKSHFLLKFQL